MQKIKDSTYLYGGPPQACSFAMVRAAVIEVQRQCVVQIFIYYSRFTKILFSFKQSLHSANFQFSDQTNMILI